jgi:hypothetical protein
MTREEHTMIRVLHERNNNDLHVLLLWNSKTNRVHVTVRDRSTGDSFVVVPDPADALEAFYHPFCFTPAAEVNGVPEVDARLAA